MATLLWPVASLPMLSGPRASLPPSPAQRASLECAHSFPTFASHGFGRQGSSVVRAQPSTATDDTKVGTAAATESPQEDAGPATEAVQVKKEFPPGSCQACGKVDKVRGCNGEGRIQGGLGAVPGFGWWPIKAYRPCPAFVEAGGRYRRQGQSLEEVAFGRKGWADDRDISDRLKGR